LGLARALGTILYRSRQEFDQRFAGPPRLPTPHAAHESANPLASLPRCPESPDSPLAGQQAISAPPLSPASIAAPVLFEVEDYLAHAARTFPSRYDANCWLLLSRCLDLMDLGRGLGGSLETALGRLARGGPHELMLLPVQQDALIPADEMQHLADVLARLGLAEQMHFERLDSIFGHDAFLKEDAQINVRLTAFLDPDAPKGVLRVRESLASLQRDL
jgi:homoserine acetyltransferase